MFGFISKAPAVLGFDSLLEEACRCPDTANKPPAAKGPGMKSSPSQHPFSRSPELAETEADVDCAQNPLDVDIYWCSSVKYMPQEILHFH